MNKNVYALAIVAHPDDESYLIAGTTRTLASENKRLALICATKGEKGVDRLNRGLSQKQLSEIRHRELIKATKILKCHNLDVLNYHDGGLEEVNISKLAKHLSTYINKYKPEIIITFGAEGISGHHDHIIVGKATQLAIGLVKVKPKELWLMQVPKSIIGDFNQNMVNRRVHHSHYKFLKLKGVPDKKLTKIDITKYSETKLKAILTHKSQHVPGLVLDYFLTHEYFEIIKLKP
jgi:LmbE family N-acetylglucosaminyl deacetylase